MGEVFEPALTQEMIDYMKIKATYDPARMDEFESSLATNTSLDNYSSIITKDSNGNITQIQVMSGATIIQTTTIVRDSNGNVSSVAETLNGKTVTTTINRSSDGTVSSTSKAVL